MSGNSLPVGSDKLEDEESSESRDGSEDEGDEAECNNDDCNSDSDDDENCSGQGWGTIILCFVVQHPSLH